MFTISELSAGYGDSPALRDFSLTVAPGGIAAVIGPNGSGKSTLLRCVAGLLRPQRGHAALDGAKVHDLDPRERARKIALLPQTFEGGQTLSVEEMVLLGRTPHLGAYGAPGKTDLQVVEQALQQCELLPLRIRAVGQLSGGERQRVLLARALAQQPRVLLLDEPTSNLDLRYQFEILSLVHRLARRENLMVVLVLHQVNLAASIADRMALLNADGSTRAEGPPAEVMTETNLAAVYGIPLRMTAHPLSGRPQAQAAWVFDEA